MSVRDFMNISASNIPLGCVVMKVLTKRNLSKKSQYQAEQWWIIYPNPIGYGQGGGVDFASHS